MASKSRYKCIDYWEWKDTICGEKHFDYELLECNLISNCALRSINDALVHITNSGFERRSFTGV